MLKCENCGNKLKFYEGDFFETPDGKMLRLCNKCLMEFKRKDKQKERMGEENEKKSANLKQHIDGKDLSIPELQLKEIIEMRKDIHTISTIVLIWFILGLIGLLISIITWVALSS
jgi:ribosome-binding protein aMBF1 (putative translation factor)